MSILHRQIFREIASYGLLGLVLFTFVLFLRDASRLLELMLRETVLFGSVARLALMAFPALLTFTIPVAVLVGILIGLSRMSSEGEVTAMRASGMSVRTFFLPVGLFAAVGCALAVYLSADASPRAARARVQLEQQIGFRQISADIQPRVFEERFPNLVLYVQDVLSGAAPVWKGIFLADLSAPAGPKITIAREGLLLSDPAQNQLQLHLVQGTVHELTEKSNEYSIATFSETDIPIAVPPPPPTSVKPNVQLSTAELYRLPPDTPEGLEARVEFHRRLALPFATLLLALVGIPLGLSSQKGGKATGLVLTLLVIVTYYSLFIGGVGLARQGRLPPWAGVWAANLLFTALGIFLLAKVDRTASLFGWLSFLNEVPEALRRWAMRVRLRSWNGGEGQVRAASANTGFPLILDRYVLGHFLFYLAVTVPALVLLIEVVTFFVDLFNDVIRNHIPASMVIDYFVHLTPQLVYLTAPLGVLVAILVSFGILSQRNEITAVKASGVSLFRLSLPVFVVTLALSGGLFLLEQFYLPEANRHQDAVRNRIKGRPAQTYYRPDRKWIFGQGSRIYYYNFFEPNEEVLGGVTVFELDPVTFHLNQRISASRARWAPWLSAWVFEDGWARQLRGSSVTDFERFEVRVFPELREEPGYFLKEVKQYTQMNFLELRSYLRDLEQSGFDVVPLAVQLYKKFSFPSFAFIMALIGMPFAFFYGKRGALTGIALSLGIAIVYYAVTGLFEALGNLSQLPPVAAAWSPNLIFGLGGLYLFSRIET